MFCYLPDNSDSDSEEQGGEMYNSFFDPKPSDGLSANDFNDSDFAEADLGPQLVDEDSDEDQQGTQLTTLWCLATLLLTSLFRLHTVPVNKTSL